MGASVVGAADGENVSPSKVGLRLGAGVGLPVGAAVVRVEAVVLEMVMLELVVLALVVLELVVLELVVLELVAVLVVVLVVVVVGRMQS